jgi:DNA polymerase IIIc chi subunit
LAFEDEQSAALALPKLAVLAHAIAWRPADKNKRVVVTCVNGEQLNALKTHLGTMGADEHAIDSVDHSIDYGDPFTVTVEVEDPRQQPLFAEVSRG